jgi:hypothetical protein
MDNEAIANHPEIVEEIVKEIASTLFIEVNRSTYR